MRTTTDRRAAWRSDAFRPRALFERFNIEVIATTEGALDDLQWHAMIRDSGWKGRVVTAYRPDAVVDPDFDGFAANLDRLGEITGCDTGTWHGYLDAHRKRRAYFKTFGATSSRPRPSDRRDGQPFSTPKPRSSVRPRPTRRGRTKASKRLFRAQMLTEMAKMSLDDGLVLQIHPGSWRNHSPAMLAQIRPRQGLRYPDAAPTMSAR